MEDVTNVGLRDLAIIGGGPAGTAAALEARRLGLSVSIWERDRFPRHKVCGEFISAESLRILEEEIPFAAFRPALIRHGEFISPRGRVHGFALPRAAYGLSRRRLDESLWRAGAARGAEVHEGEHVKSVERLPRSGGRSTEWAVESVGGATARATALTVCAGRWWSLEGIPGPARSDGARVGEWLGVKAHFANISSRDAVEMYYFPGGYCGLAPIEDGLYNACCLMHRSLARNASGLEIGDFGKWIASVSGHGALSRRLREGSQASKTVTTAPVEPARRRADEHGALMVGDAAGFLDPFTGDGISIALHSGRLAARCLAEYLEGNREPEGMAHAATNYRRELNQAVGSSYRLAGVLRGLVRAPGWLQESVAATLARLGPRLEAATRWRSDGATDERAEGLAREDKEAENVRAGQVKRNVLERKSV